MRKIGVPGGSGMNETRIPLIPEQVVRLIQLGSEVAVESGLGKTVRLDDAEYEKAGARIQKDRKKLIEGSEILLGIRKPDPKDIRHMAAGSVYAGMLDPFNEKGLITNLAKQGVSAISMELIPRSTRAQKMDILSSQASLAGYVAVMLAAGRLDQIFPMMMTPAGTLKPSRVFVVGAGVAGLQAIATAKRLGARVEAFDTRPAVKEEVQSLGAKFIEIDLGETGQTKDGYAKGLTEAQLKNQQEGMARICAHSDVIITTAQVFGKTAPRIITREMIRGMTPGSVIVDMAVETGGNVEGSKPDAEVEIDGVRIIGPVNPAGRVARHASQMISSNLFNLISEFWDKEEKRFILNVEDEIMRSALVTHDGRIVNDMLSQHYAK
ncbi:MAG TPA: NAD(P) transhydrogenase subunit alpha [bacterium]|nr:NAD(P) transhydrogenase subunit alpha [bacterium]